MECVRTIHRGAREVSVPNSRYKRARSYAVVSRFIDHFYDSPDTFNQAMTSQGRVRTPTLSLNCKPPSESSSLGSPAYRHQRQHIRRHRIRLQECGDVLLSRIHYRRGDARTRPHPS